MNTEMIRLLFSYAIAATLIVGGLTFLFFAMDKPSASTSGLLVVVGGFVGAAIQFVFGGAQASQATRAYAAGVNTPAPSQEAPHQ